MPKLTKTMIDNTAPAAADVWLWDAELPGFGVRVQPSGRKTYVTRYRTQDGKQRKTTVARCCDMPPDRARDLARKVFASVAEGKDPAQERREAKEAPTLEDMRDRYMREHAAPFKKPRSAALDAGNWRLHIDPSKLAGKRVKDITKADILALHGGLADKPATANQVLALLSKAFNLAEDWGWRDPASNPCRRVRKYSINERELILTPDQISDLNRAMDALVEERAIPYAMAVLVRLLMLTGCRLNEIMSARREWVDTQRGLLLLPDSKVGQRKIPLSAPAIGLILTMPQTAQWLIPGRVSGTHMTSPYDSWAKIKERAGLPAALRPHDLRHTAGSLAHAAGLSQKQVATMLGHKQLSTTERYLHGHVGEGAKIADTLAEVVTKSWATS